MHTFDWLVQNIIECLWILATYFKFSVIRMMTHSRVINERHVWGPPPQKMMTHHCPLSMGDKWASCFDTGSINVHDWWASEWWLILRWWMGVMSRRQSVYFVWMVQHINKHRPIDLYNVNSQQEQVRVLQSMRCYYLYIIYIFFRYYFYIIYTIIICYLDII